MKRLVLLSLTLLLLSNFTFAQSVIIGTGTSTSNGSTADPVERYYNYEHHQIVYLASELSGGGMTAGAQITALGFSISESAVSLANYTILMGHTTQTLASPYIPTAGLSTVRSAFTYAPAVQTAGNFDMITFSSNFTWDGTSNIVIDICTGSNPFTTPYGGLRYTAATSGAMRGIRSDGSSNCGTATSTNSAYRPNIRLDYTPGNACSGTPAPGNTVSSANPVCPGNNFTLSLQNATPGTGVTYQWQSGPTNSGPWTNIGSSTPTHTTSQTSATWYQCLVTCDSNTGTSTPVQVNNVSAVSSFTENFDGVTVPAFPGCWAKVGTGGTANTQSSSANSAPNCLYMYSSSTSSLAVVKMDEVSNLGSGTHRFRFNMRANFTVGGVVEFGYLTDPTDAATFVSLGTATASALTYNEYVIIPSSGSYSNFPAIRHTGSPANSLLIDDVKWEPAPTDAVDWCNLQWPATANILAGTSVDVYAQTYEPGVTPGAGSQGAGINAWIGYSNSNTNPSSWTNWSVATFNAAGGGANNDEYQYALGTGLTPGTYYYASRFQLNGGPYKYGGYNAGGGGFWDGTTNVSGVLTINPTPNDECSGATAFPVIPIDGTCVTLSNQSTLGATNSNVTPSGACTSNSGTPDDDVWFSFVAPATSVILEATFVSGNSDVYWHVFSSACASSMTAILCTDNNGGGTLTGLTIGNTYYIRLYTYSSGVSTVQNICLKTPPAPPSNDNCAGASQFPMIPTDGTCVTLSNQSTAGATNSNVTPTGACTSNSGTPDDDVWFSFVAPAASVILEATHVSGSTDVYWHVFSSSCGGTMTAILCTDTDAGGTLTGLTIGNTYFIRLYTWSSGVSTVKNICLKTPPPPPDCATLNTPIDGSTGVTLTTALTWTPAGTGGNPTSYKVYHGTANPPTTFSTVTAPTTTFTPSGRAYSTLYYWYVVPSNASGDATGCNTTIFSYTTEAPPPPPANNDPCDGTALTFGGSQTGTTVNATASSVPNQECDGFTNTSADVWYKIDNVDIFPGGTLIITIDPSASQDYAIYLYSYTDCSAPVFITCDDDGFGGENETILYTIPSFDGGNGSSNRDLTNYLVRVKQWSTASGTFSLSLAGTLPLELLDIKATVMPKYNLIEWSTASEKNTSHMVVERNDGSSLRWEEIGKTEAAGFSSDIRLYSFEDARPYQKAYYRVRSVDRDGLELVSRKVFVDRTNVNGSPGLVNAYPLPVSKSLFVDLNLDNDQSTTFHLMTITGQSVMLLHRELKAGVQTIELDLSDLPSGVYLARISNPELSETVRIIKE